MRTEVVAALITLFLTQTALADKYICAFDHFDQLGHSQPDQDAMVASYLGEKFYIDTGKKIIQRGWKTGWAKPDHIADITHTSKFSAYIWTKTSTDQKGKPLKNRFSYRIYGNGQTVAHMATLNGQYASLEAKGACKKR